MLVLLRSGWRGAVTQVEWVDRVKEVGVHPDHPQARPKIPSSLNVGHLHNVTL